jgi:hypothetical protein
MTGQPWETQLRDALAAAEQERDVARARLALTETERDQLAAELIRVKQLHAEWLGRFFRGSAGWDARVSGVVLARAYRDANLPVREDLSHLAGQ